MTGWISTDKGGYFRRLSNLDRIGGQDHRRKSGFVPPADSAFIYVQFSDDLLPGHVVDLPIPEDHSLVDVGDGVHGSTELALQLYKAVDVLIDFLLQADDLTHGIRHCGTAMIGFPRHTRQRGGAFGSKLIQRSNLCEFRIDYLGQYRIEKAKRSQI